MDMLNKMNKRRKDQGFTLIELMIVIAVIGILAIVLVPKVGTIKTQAKGAGIETNVRMVQGYLQSKASKWVDQKDTTENVVAKDIYNAFNNSGDNEKMKNPFSQKDSIGVDTGLVTGAPALATDNALQIRTSFSPTDATVSHGATVVVVPTSTATGTVNLTVYGLDNAGAVATTVVVTP